MYTAKEKWTVVSSTIRYLVRFIELPFLFTGFFLILFILMTALHSPGLQDKAVSIFLWPLFGIFQYPETFQTVSFQPVLLVSAFWLFIIHLFLEILAIFSTKGSGSMEISPRKFIHLGLWSLLIIALFSLLFASNVSEKADMAVFLILITLVGQASYWLSGKLLQIVQRKNIIGK